jgi:hypothetical protein
MFVYHIFARQAFLQRLGMKAIYLFLLHLLQLMFGINTLGSY